MLETGAGTGVLTRAMREALPAAWLTATDLNEAMLANARSQHADLAINWHQAEAHRLDFPTTRSIEVQSVGGYAAMETWAMAWSTVS